MNHFAIYMKGGYRIYHVAYGFESSLPSDIKDLVKSNYSDYSIENSLVLDQDGRIIWMAGIKAPGECMMICVENGRIWEVYRLHNPAISGSVTSMIKKK